MSPRPVIYRSLGQSPSRLPGVIRVDTNSDPNCVKFLLAGAILPRREKKKIFGKIRMLQTCALSTERKPKYLPKSYPAANDSHSQFGCPAHLFAQPSARRRPLGSRPHPPACPCVQRKSRASCRLRNRRPSILPSLYLVVFQHTTFQRVEQNDFAARFNDAIDVKKSMSL